MSYRVVFMGTPHIADEVLKNLINNKEIEIVAVVCQPDKPVGRKRRLTPPDTKITALKHNIEVLQPEKIRRNKEFKSYLKKLEPDFLVVIAYGKILPNSILKIPKEIPINIHASLLPKYRGASPIQQTLLNRDELTGVTIIKMDRGMDTGDMLQKESIELTPEDDYSSLENKIIKISNKMMDSFFSKYKDNEIIYTPQDENATYCYFVEKKDGLLDFNLSTDTLMGKIKAYSVWPKAYFMIDDKRFIINNAVGIKEKHNFSSSKIVLEKKKMFIYTKDGYLDIKMIQPQAKKSMNIPSFFNGYKKYFI